MWFIAIGGFERTIKKLFGSVVTPFTNEMFINAVLGSIFMMKKNRDPEDEYDKDDYGVPKEVKKIWET